MNKYTATIIGAGSIGAWKPGNVDKKYRTAHPLTHANACYKHPRIELDCIVDSDFDKAARAGKKWDCSFGNTIVKPSDIFIIATPTETHLEVFHECLKFGPKLIIMEKPAGQNLSQCYNIYDSSGDIPVMVDFSRRFEPFHQGVALKLQDPKTDIYNARVIYARGLKHEGSHAIDLCNWWFGECYSMTRQGLDIIDRDEKDPTGTLDIFNYVACPVVFTGVDGRFPYTFEIDVITSIGRFQFYHYGLYFRHWKIINDGKYGSYNQLEGKQKYQHTEMGWNLSRLMDNAVNFLDGAEDLKCTIDDALAVHKILEG